MGILQTGYNSGGYCHRKKIFLDIICDKGTLFLRVLISNNFT